MKYIVYILTFVWILISCAGQEKSRSQKSVETDDYPLSENFDSRVLPVEKAQTTEEREELVELTTQDFDEIARQKIQQFYDMISASSTTGSPSGYKEYMTEHARKLWLHPEKALQWWKNTGWQKIDSIEIQDYQLLDMEEISPEESAGTYKVLLKIYQSAGTKTIKQKVRIYFDVLDLALDDQVYKSIKAKILSIE